MGLQERAEALGAKGFLGVPVKDFEAGGREQLAILVCSGLTANSKVVDIGCGVLRAGYWLIQFLNADCYCGIEPHKQRLEMGTSVILEPDMLRAKRPRFDTNADFNTSVFGQRFDFFVAYSIWTHASKPQIEIMLDSFLRDSTENAIFCATFLPAGWAHSDYRADGWFGTSHESAVPGCIRHSYGWVRNACNRRGLNVLRLGWDEMHQYWLKISRKAEPEQSKLVAHSGGPLELFRQYARRLLNLGSWQ